jgi:hypothetical protein
MEGRDLMPHRTRAWIWAGRAVAVAAVAGLAGYLAAAGLDQAGRLAAPVGLVIALTALLAPYLLPVYQPPAPSSARPADPEPPAGPEGGIVIIADHGSVAAQHIGEVSMHTPRPDAPDCQAGT